MLITASVAVTSSPAPAVASQGIKVYSVPKEIKKAPSAAAVDPHLRDPAAAGQTAAPGEGHEAPLHWETPSGWKELPPTDLRVGNFLISKGDKKAVVSIISFPEKTGTELDNVNRWRGEIGLEPVGKSDAETVAIGDQPGKIYDFAGKQMQTIAASLMRGETSWFFKMRGDKGIVSENKTAFIQLLKSIHFHDQETSAPSESPVAAPVAVPAQPIVSAAKEVGAEAGEPKWDLPSGWKEKPASTMVFKTFSSGEAPNEAKIAISVFPGDVGGTLANVNRWRNQLSLKPITEADLPKSTTSLNVVGGKATLAELAGTDARTGQPSKMVAAIVPHGERTWFYKLTGNEAAVAREKEVFLKFVQTVRY